MKKLKNLAETNTTNAVRHHQMNDNSPRKNGIECPDCGKELLDSCPMITLASMPPKKNIHCEECSYSGYRVA